MSENRHITKIIAAIMAVAVIVCLLAVGYSDTLADTLDGATVSLEYETKLFDTDEIIEIDITMDEDEWQKMLDGAMSEEYYSCDVTVNGLAVSNVGIRPKGNTSLSAIANDPDTNRYSLKLEFDHYDSGQTCFGLDKLILNNNYADATSMKEAIVYDMYEYLNADASLYNYAKVSLNGEYIGLYLALEGVEDSFMLRNFGTQKGNLYKPDSMEMGGGDDKRSGGPGEDFDPEKMKDMKPPTDKGDFDPEKMKDMKPPTDGGFTMGGGGANLNYTDDDLDSYSTIWDGDITGVGKNDKKRVVKALKNISEGNDIEKYLDIDNILKYMAVHTFAVNMDSLTGNMAHNYYLYESDGQLNIFPWDYNLSFGGMSMGNSGNATDMVNYPIDTPFQGSDFFNAILENEEYLEKYHEYLRVLAKEYVEGGRFEEVYERIRSNIDTLVETDPTAFYDYESYDAAAAVLVKTIKLRAESIIGQLDGVIPSTSEGQKEDASALIDASSIDVKVMGEFNMGGAKGGFKRRGMP